MTSHSCIWKSPPSCVVGTENIQFDMFSDRLSLRFSLPLCILFICVALFKFAFSFICVALFCLRCAFLFLYYFFYVLFLASTFFFFVWWCVFVCIFFFVCVGLDNQIIDTLPGMLMIFPWARLVDYLSSHIQQERVE